MARSDARETRRVIRRITRLLQEGSKARTEDKKHFPVRDAFDFDIMQRALEAFRDILKAGLTLDP